MHVRNGLLSPHMNVTVAFRSRRGDFVSEWDELQFRVTSA